MKEYKQLIETIGRSKAQSYLDKNIHNRHLNSRTVTHYANQMVSGEWKINGDSIKFASDGTLLDGQHRLAAVVKADKTINFPVFRGVELDAVKTIDTGKSRSLADHLKMHGFKSVCRVDMRTVAAAIRVILDFEKGIYTQRKRKITPTAAIDFLTDHSGLLDSCAFTVDLRGAIFLPPSLLAATHYLCSKTGADKTDAFFTQLASGANLSLNSPILTLKNRLTQVNLPGRKVIDKKLLLSYVFQSFKAFKAGEDLTAEELKHDHATRVVAP